MNINLIQYKLLLFACFIALSACGGGSSNPPPMPESPNKNITAPPSGGNNDSNNNGSSEEDDSDKGSDNDSQDNDSSEDDDSGENNNSQDNDPSEDSDSGDENDSSGDDNSGGDNNQDKDPLPGGDSSESSSSSEDNNSSESSSSSEDNNSSESSSSSEGSSSSEDDSSSEGSSSSEGKSSSESSSSSEGSSSSDSSSSSEDSSSSEPAANAIYMKNTLGYTQPYVHYWDMDLEPAGNGPWDSVWPGHEMTLLEGQVYTYLLPDEVPVDANIGIVFNNGDDTAQTDDLIFSASNNCYSNGEWSPLAACQDGTAPSPSENKSVYVHLFEWSWKDIAEECEQWLGPKGYAAVQVPPPQEHIQGNQWWTRYQPVSFNIDQSRSGTRTEFIDMVERCNAVDVDIYVDAVINHMAAGDSSGTGSAGTAYNPVTLDYPNLSAQDFHDDCTVENSDYGNNANRVRTCRLVGLRDLKTGSEYVRDLLASYMNDLIAIGVKGFRIDAAKHMAVSDIEAIISRLDDDVYVFQEVIDLGGEAVSSSEYTAISDVTEFKYSAEIGRVFRHGELEWLKNFNEAWGIDGSGEHFMPSQNAVVFTDNHDNQRGHGAGGANILTHKDGALYDLSNIFMLAWPYGYPKVMSSYAFTDTEIGPPTTPVHGGPPNCFEDEWICEHRWQPIANMVEFRNQSASHPMTHWWAEGNQIAFGRGDRGFVIINRSELPLTQTLETGMAPGEYCNVIESDFDANTSSCSTTVIVGGTGQISVNLDSMKAIAIHAGARL